MKRLITVMRPADYLEFAHYALVMSPCTLTVFLLAMVLPIITASYIVQHMGNLQHVLISLLYDSDWLVMPMIYIIAWFASSLAVRMAAEVMFGCILAINYRICHACDHK